ncbi:GGDEF domain-containing protein [Oceanicoccus sp. KOV_DT_Chl]|uniref:GGDEF domain-containing protein n=1 Tax=Oceanicoccus sp. KOV_DT_Chl TaxID=1904639 RepID=UPI00135899BC|nr:GGDEF domain-containing protein [Oceanicoccus sp. KOV_DT_Chl]
MQNSSINQEAEFTALEHQQLLKLMLRDNAGRARGGTFIYAVLWLVIGVGSGWYQQQASLFWGNLVFLLAFGLVRLWVLSRVEFWAESNRSWARFCYLGVILVNPLHMGVLAALSIYSEAWSSIQVPLLLFICGIAAAGTSVLSIDRYIRYLFPSFCMLPAVVVLCLDLNTDNALIAFLCLGLTAYLIITSAIVNRDYWRALRTSKLLEAKAAELHQLSVTDPLTQLYNRLYFEKQFDLEWRRAHRSQHSLAILIVDLDHFKRINDNFGHGFGDYCLQHSAQMISQQMVRAGDFVARYGGEEFIVLLPNTDVDGGLVVANKIREAIKLSELVQGQHRTIVTASIGMAVVTPADDVERHSLVKLADTALYRAKELGRDRVELAAESWLQKLKGSEPFNKSVTPT